MTRLEAAAKTYVGTKFRHRGRSTYSVDCAGLIKRVYLDCGQDLPDFVLYSSEPHDDGLIQYITAAMGEPVAKAPVKRSQLQVDDVIVQRFDQQPHHVALLISYPVGGLAMIHADGHTGRVVEHRLSDDHIKRITHVFRKPL